MAKIILDYKKEDEKSKTIGQGDIIVMEYPKETHTYIVFTKCEKNKTPQTMLVSLDGGAGLMRYDNLGNMTHKKFKSCFQNCDITIIPKNDAVIKIDKITQ